MRYIDKYGDIGFKILFVILGFMFYSNIFFGYPLYSYAQTFTLILGFLLLVYRWIFRAEDFFRKEIIVLSLFLFSHVLSSVLNLQYGYYENFKAFVFMAFDFYLLFPTSRKMEMSEYKKQFQWLLKVFIFIATVSSLISLLMMYQGYGEIVYLPPDNHEVLHGFMWGRLFGVYYDPNYGSTFTAIALLGSIYFVIKHPKNVFYYVSILLNYLYIIFSDSRTGLLAVFVGLFIYTFVYLYKRKKASIIILALFLTCGFNIIAPKIIKSGYNYIIAQEVQEEKKTDNKSSENTKKKRVGREEDLKGDFSNRRFDLWKSGLEIFEDNKLYGVGFKNLLPYMEQNIPETYAINNDNYSKFDNMHNIIFNVLPGQGIIGLIIMFMTFIIFFLKLRIMIFDRKMIDQDLTSILLGICGIVGVSMMTVTDCIYVITPSSTMFWISLGLLMKLFDQKNITDKTQKVLLGYISNSGPGGIDKYINNVLDSIKDEKLQIDCLTSNPSQDLESQLAKRNVSLYKINRLTKPFKRYYDTVKILKKNNYDIVYFNVSESFDCICNLAARNYSNAIIITHSHSSGNDESNKVKRYIVKFLHLIFRPILKECTDYYYACSSEAAKWLFGKKILKNENYRIIRNTIEADAFEFNETYREAIRKQLSIKDDDILIGFVGSFAYSKNVLYLIDVFNELNKFNPHYQLLMIGDGELFDLVHAKCEHLDILDKTHLIGSQTDVYKYYSAMDLFMLLSNFEGLPIVGIEAQVNGLHCCFSDHITREVQICDNVSFHSINQSSSSFAKEINQINLERNNHPSFFQDIYYALKAQQKEFVDIFIKRNFK